MDKTIIRIKESHKGKFTEWAKRHGHKGVTDAAIEEGLVSNSAKTKVRAQFAKNARKFEY